MIKFRSIYIKFRYILKENKAAINTAISSFMLIVLLSMFVNYIIIERLIFTYANASFISKQYDKAIIFYNISDIYYKLFHQGNGVNKENYLALPYKKANCYFYLKKKEDSYLAMIDALNKIQDEYGYFSRENSIFMRKYLIEFYIENNQINSAKIEYKNLLKILKEIHYDNNEMADLIRLSGDIHFAQKHYELAVNLYTRAAKALASIDHMDNDIFIKTVLRTANYHTKTGHSDYAHKAYENSIKTLQEQKKPSNKHIATMLIENGRLYQKDGKTKQAIPCFEEAIELVKTLPKVSYLRQSIETYYNELKDLYQTDGQFHKVREIEQILENRKHFGFLA